MIEAGPTGDFPRGKLNETDEGELRIAIGSERGNVRLDFGKPTAWIAMSPDQALALASLIVKHAMEIKRTRPRGFSDWVQAKG